MKIIGIEDGTYTSKKDGQVKEGYRFYVTDNNRPNVIGEACEDVWVSARAAAGFLRQFTGMESVVGAEVIFLYNRFRRVEAIMPASVMVSQE